MRTLLTLSLLALAALFNTAQSQTEAPFSKTIDWSSQSLDEARKDLEEIRTEIAAQQKPQLQELSRIQSEVTALRRERNQLKFQTDSMKDQVEKRSARVQAIASQQQDVQYRLLHIRRKFEENLHPIESPNYRETFLSLEQIKDDTPAARLDRLKALFAIAEKASDRIDDRIGGSRYSAKALAESVVVNGTALQIGPYVFFDPDEGDAGLIVVGEDLITRLRQRTPGTSQAITAGLNGNDVSLPFDPLLDQAFLNADAQTSFSDHLRSGGIWIIPITLFGVLSSIIALLKLLQIRAIRIPPTELIASLADTADPQEFERQLDPPRSLYFRRRFRLSKRPRKRSFRRHEPGDSRFPRPTRISTFSPSAHRCSGPASRPSRHRNRHDQNLPNHQPPRSRRRSNLIGRHLGSSRNNRIRPSRCHPRLARPRMAKSTLQAYFDPNNRTR
jgi:biopolymer transport protein ExbB/TolQ